MRTLSKELRNKMLDRLNCKAGGFAYLVAPLYAQLGWKWHKKTMPLTSADIEDAIRKDLLHPMREGDSMAMETGGLRVEFEGDDDNGWEVSLKFIYDITVYEGDLKL